MQKHGELLALLCRQHAKGIVLHSGQRELSIREPLMTCVVSSTM
jgi:hypothetical protein